MPRSSEVLSSSRSSRSARERGWRALPGSLEGPFGGEPLMSADASNACMAGPRSGAFETKVGFSIGGGGGGSEGRERVCGLFDLA